LTHTVYPTFMTDIWGRPADNVDIEELRQKMKPVFKVSYKVAKEDLDLEEGEEISIVSSVKGKSEASGEKEESKIEEYTIDEGDEEDDLNSIELRAK